MKCKHSLASDMIVYGLMVVFGTAVLAEWVSRNV